MVTKVDAPKLSAAERLARKRAAARLRQQRCRARKRQAMLEKKRGEIVRQRVSQPTHDAKRSTGFTRVVHPRPLFPTYKAMHSQEASDDPWARGRDKGSSQQQINKTTTAPIYHCVSFESQKSLEEAQQNMSSVSSVPPRSPSQETSTVVTPRQIPPQGKQVRVIRENNEKKVDVSLVSEEEAAVAAMLSLKSGTTKPTRTDENESKEAPQSPPREVMISQKATTTACSGPRRMHPEQIYHDQHKHMSFRSQQQRRIVARRYEAYNYGQAMTIPPLSRRPHVSPGYYRVHPSVPHPHPQYARCYYSQVPRYVSYEYE